MGGGVPRQDRQNHQHHNHQHHHHHHHHASIIICIMVSTGAIWQGWLYKILVVPMAHFWNSPQNPYSESALWPRSNGECWDPALRDSLTKIRCTVHHCWETGRDWIREWEGQLGGQCFVYFAQIIFNLQFTIYNTVCSSDMVDREGTMLWLFYTNNIP